MKTMFLKSSEFKVFVIGVGVSVGFLTLSFLTNFFRETRDQIRSRARKQEIVTPHKLVSTSNELEYN